MDTRTAVRTTSPVNMFEPETEGMPREMLAALQTERLKRVLQTAYEKVPHYRKQFDKHGVRPSDLKDVSDIVKFPFTVKTDLRDNSPCKMFAVPREQVVRVHASSGTTGKPTVVGYTQKDISTWCDLMARSFACGGTRPGDSGHNA